jgi:hypothetical protein
MTPQTGPDDGRTGRIRHDSRVQLMAFLPSSLLRGATANVEGDDPFGEKGVRAERRVGRRVRAPEDAEYAALLAQHSPY